MSPSQLPWRSQQWLSRRSLRLFEPYLYCGEDPQFAEDSADLMREHFPNGRYRDVPGLCKAATIDEIAAQGWSLNPGRYVGVAAREAEAFDFRERLEQLNEELEKLNLEAHALEERISANVAALLEERPLL
jgi:type I restriction enzyme M protein